MQDKLVTEEMMLRVLIGEASQQEIAAVTVWKRANAKNLLEFQRYESIWRASLIDKPVEVDTEYAWMRMKELTAQRRMKKEERRGYPAPGLLLRIAAVLVLGIAVAALTFSPATDLEGQFSSVAAPENAAAPERAIPSVAMEQVLQQNSLPAREPERPVRQAKVKAKQERSSPSGGGSQVSIPALVTEAVVEESILNSTLCPVEICIRQTIVCDDYHATPFAYCSVLQPDEHGQLQYTQPELTSGICQATVDEITIKRISTGETITLSATSSPVTAQEFFDYINGNRTGHIKAGAFEGDCNNLCLNDPIQLDNSMGRLVLH